MPSKIALASHYPAQRPAQLQTAESWPWNRAAKILRLTWPYLELGSMMFYSVPLMDPWPIPKADVSLDLRRATPADLPLLVNNYSDPSRSYKFRERFRQGDFCFMALDEAGRVVHYRWVTKSLSRISELGMDLIPRPGEVCMYDIYTRPDARNRGVSGQVGCFAFNCLLEDGFEKVSGYVRSDNPTGLRVAKFWAHMVGRVWYLRIGQSQPWILGRTHKLDMPVLVRCP